MTEPKDRAEGTTESFQEPQAIIPPKIRSEVDKPFGEDDSGGLPPRNNLSQTESIEDLLSQFKHVLGKNVLYISMIAMGVSVLASIILSVLKVENAMVEGVFEVFKLIAMTVLGYIFGSKS